MATLENALQQLRAEQREARLHVEKLGQAISVIEGLYDVGICPEKNRRSTTGMVGEVEGWTEEDGVKYAARTKARCFAGGIFSWMRNHCGLDTK
jgi:hypothetical protein